MAMSQTIEPQRNPGATPATSPIIAPEIRALEARVNEASQWVQPLKRQMATVIVGQKLLVDRLIIGLLTNGHLLLEILTGALQDYGRALVVGDSSTFGKGTVQSVLPLARIMDEAGLAHTYDPGALKVTIQKFYPPSGASTQLRGVVSDIVLPSTSDFSDE